MLTTSKYQTISESKQNSKVKPQNQPKPKYNHPRNRNALNKIQRVTPQTPNSTQGNPTPGANTSKPTKLLYYTNPTPNTRTQATRPPTYKVYNLQPPTEIKQIPEIKQIQESKQTPEIKQRSKNQVTIQKVNTYTTKPQASNSDAINH